MPSRRNKALRDKNITRNFFSQGEPSTRSSSAEQSHSYATNLTTAAANYASMYPLKKSLIETDHRTDAEKMRTRLSALWREKYNNLTTEEREEFDMAKETLPVISEHRSVMQALNLTHQQTEDVLRTIADETVRREAFDLADFDLADLDRVTDEYNGLCKIYKDRGEGRMATLAKTISKSASIASDTTRSTENRLAAELDVLNLNIDSRVTLPLISCLRQVQLFNIEKRFGFVEDSYQVLNIEDGRKPEEDLPAELPRTFCQRLNEPFNRKGPAPKTRQKKGEKKLSGLEALAQLQRNLKLASEEIQELKATNDTQDFEELPCVSPTLTYADVPIPEDIPHHVQQRFSDADFALEQIAVLIEEATAQRVRVHNVLLAWNHASQLVWYVHFQAIAPIELVDRMPTQFLSWKTPYRF